MKEKIKDVVIRCIKTFIQGFLATLVLSMQNGQVEITQSLLIGAFSSGICAVMNLCIKLLEKGEANEL